MHAHHVRKVLEIGHIAHERQLSTPAFGADTAHKQPVQLDRIHCLQTVAQKYRCAPVHLGQVSPDPFLLRGPCRPRSAAPRLAYRSAGSRRVTGRTSPETVERSFPRSEIYVFASSTARLNVPRSSVCTRRPLGNVTKLPVRPFRTTNV